MGRAPPPRPRKRLGQHFLSDPRILDRIVGALQLRGDETVIEIGAGRGALTERLAGACKKLVAVELDRVLAPRLREQFADRPNVGIVESDILDVPLASLADGPFVVVGNVPYYITTPIIFHALERPRADRIVLLVQREVADRLAAKPDTSEYGALTVNVQSVASVEAVFNVAAGSFSPPPKVDSAVVRIAPLATPVVEPDEEDGFRRFVQVAFAQRRKQLKAVVRAVANAKTAQAEELLRSARIDP